MIGALARRVQAEPLDDNAPRFPQHRGKGHVESYFVRANHPRRRQAIWIKATVLARPAGQGPAVAEVWCAFFDGDAGTVWAHKETVAPDRLVVEHQRFWIGQGEHREAPREPDVAPSGA